MGDNLRITGENFYLGVPDSDGSASLAATNEDTRDRFVATGTLPENDDLDQPRAPMSHHPPAPLLAVALQLGQVQATPVSRRVLFSYDDRYSIEYMHRKLLPYWRRQFPAFEGMLEAADREYASLEKRSEQYDAELEQDLVRVAVRNTPQLPYSHSVRRLVPTSWLTPGMARRSLCRRRISVTVPFPRSTCCIRLRPCSCCSAQNWWKRNWNRFFATRNHRSGSFHLHRTIWAFIRWRTDSSTRRRDQRRGPDAGGGIRQHHPDGCRAGPC